MPDISDADRSGLPSSASLLKATAIALLVAGVLLVTTVLPFEYGIDPTGLGAKMGLTKSAPAVETGDVPAQTSGNLLSSSLGPVWKSASAFRSDSLELVLQPDEGAEIKAKMQAGERFVFSWQVQGGQVSFDMHGEPPNAGDEFSSYWRGNGSSSAHGAFEAPFEGTHGWYWHNSGDGPVTVRVTTNGYYQTLYKP